LRREGLNKEMKMVSFIRR